MVKSWDKGLFMNQKDLIYIKTIVDEGGVSQAAKKLFVSQPSLSQSVKRIEDSLGVELFKRTPRGLVLTAEGEEYYHMAHKVMRIYDSFEDEIHNIKEFKSGKVVIGTTPHRGNVLFPEFLSQFYLKYPDVTVTMVEVPTNELEELLLKGAVDVALLREPANPTMISRRFHYHGLSRETYMLVLPKGHPAGVYAEVSEGEEWPVLDPKWLAEEAFLLPESSLRLYENIAVILKEAGVDLSRSTYHAFYMDTLVYLAMAGVGPAIVTPRYVRKREVREKADVYRIPERYGTFWEVSFATLRDSYVSRAAAKFMEEYRIYLGLDEELS